MAASLIHPRGVAEGFLKVETDPARAEVVRLGDWAVRWMHGAGIADGNGIEFPALCEFPNARNQFAKA